MDDAATIMYEDRILDPGQIRAEEILRDLNQLVTRTTNIMNETHDDLERVDALRHLNEDEGARIGENLNNIYATASNLSQNMQSEVDTGVDILRSIDANLNEKNYYATQIALDRLNELLTRYDRDDTYNNFLARVNVCESDREINRNDVNSFLFNTAIALKRDMDSFVGMLDHQINDLRSEYEQHGEKINNFSRLATDEKRYKAILLVKYRKNFKELGPMITKLANLSQSMKNKFNEYIYSPMTIQHINTIKDVFREGYGHHEIYNQKVMANLDSVRALEDLVNFFKYSPEKRKAHLENAYRKVYDSYTQSIEDVDALKNDLAVYQERINNLKIICKIDTNEVEEYYTNLNRNLDEVRNNLVSNREQLSIELGGEVGKNLTVQEGNAIRAKLFDFEMSKGGPDITRDELRIIDEKQHGSLYSKMRDNYKVPAEYANAGDCFTVLPDTHIQPENMSQNNTQGTSERRMSL